MLPFWMEIDAASLARLVTVLIGGFTALLSIGVLRGGRV